MFWNSCFLGFSKEYTLTIGDLIQCEQCALCLLLVCTDLIGKVFYSQLVYICLVLSVGFSLNSGILNYGIKIFDGGAGMQVFLFSAVFFMVAWIIETRLKKLEVTHQKHWYHGQSIALIGLLLIIYSWPSVNMAGAVLTSKNTLTTIAQLQTSAFSNTIFGMTGGILSSMLMMGPQNKTPITTYIEAIINVTQLINCREALSSRHLPTLDYIQLHLYCSVGSLPSQQSFSSNIILRVIFWHIFPNHPLGLSLEYCHVFLDRLLQLHAITKHQHSQTIYLQ